MHMGDHSFIFLVEIKLREIPTNMGMKRLFQNRNKAVFFLQTKTRAIAGSDLIST